MLCGVEEAKRQRLMLRWLARDPWLTSAQMGAVLGCKPDSATTYLAELKAKGWVQSLAPHEPELPRALVYALTDEGLREMARVKRRTVAEMAAHYKCSRATHIRIHNDLPHHWRIREILLCKLAAHFGGLNVEWCWPRHFGKIFHFRDYNDKACRLRPDCYGLITCKNKPLKAIPAKARGDPHIKALQARKRELEQQVARMRSSLEQAMCRGDTFTGAELRGLMRHPLLANLLARLVFIGDDAIGYLVDEGIALQDYAGRHYTLKASVLLRLAHPHDLLMRKDWHRWQQECFAAERVQPFKQIFRELYTLTETEKNDGGISRRYAGQQVNPRQAMALLGQRNWIANVGEGAERVFHDEGIIAWLTFLSGWATPAEVEGYTLEGVRFQRRGAFHPMPLTDVPPRIFSEVMRDLDLVVSVAHVGGVDPEASASTVDMRVALVQETCAMLKLMNVRVQGKRVFIEGQLGKYSVHLGSAVVHQQPGGALCIVPVHAQQHGRLFLPFADHDPTTAEVLSKILLLARDTEIKDSVILEQIVAVG